VLSAWRATRETLRAYVDAQGSEEHARKSAAKAKTKPIGLERGMRG
jgi:putative transposase